MSDLGTPWWGRGPQRRRTRPRWRGCLLALAGHQHEVVAELRLDGGGDRAFLAAERRVLERLDHLALAEPAEIAAALAARACRMLARESREIRATLDLLLQIQSRCFVLHENVACTHRPAMGGDPFRGRNECSVFDNAAAAE